MYIKKISIKNYRLFSDQSQFEINNLNVPDGTTEGSGLNVFIGENGCGKTSLLEAFSLPLLPYKADDFSLADLRSHESKSVIKIYSESDFKFKATIGKTIYTAKGFEFTAGIRSRANKNYLSSIIVNDQKFIKADGEFKPNDESPDLRVNVTNPWSGPRFNENDVLYLGKNRTYQVRSGTYNPTRFDKLMEDLDFQYLKLKGNPIDCNYKLNGLRNGVENEFLQNTIDKFKKISGEEVKLSFLDNSRPHKNAFFSVETDSGQQISLDGIGSGFEMIFSLIYSFYLSQQSGKQLIALIDEAELHLHPRIQREFVKILFEFSKSAQIILTSHSPLFVKQILENEEVNVTVLKKVRSKVSTESIVDRVLPYLSSNEINFVAFNLATEEYHNELYEEFKITHGLGSSYKQFDNDFFIVQKGESKSFPWKGNPKEVSKHTYIRNQIHHQKENGKTEYDDLESSIVQLKSFFSYE